MLQGMEGARASGEIVEVQVALPGDSVRGDAAALEPPPPTPSSMRFHSLLHEEDRVEQSPVSLRVVDDVLESYSSSRNSVGSTAMP